MSPAQLDSLDERARILRRFDPFKRPDLGVDCSKMDSELKAIIHASDEALNGSEWVQYFCHPTELYKSFVKFYYAHVATEEYGISWKLSEMMRHMVAVHNTCTL